MEQNKILSVVIPAYNEAATIQKVLMKVCGVSLIAGFKIEIIVINDCSTDDTERVVQLFMSENKQFPIRYFVHSKNKGKGAAIQLGISEARGEYLVIQDADLEYDPNEFNDLLRPAVEGHADIVYGSRFRGNNPHRVLFFWHSIGNMFLTFLSNMMNNLNLSDMETCYKLFDTKMLQSISLKEKRFGFEPEVTAKIAKIPNVRIYEVGISYYGRTYAEGKKIGWKDGFRAIYCIVKYGAMSKKSFLIS